MNLLAEAADADNCEDGDEDDDENTQTRKIQTSLRIITPTHESLCMWIEKIVLLNDPVGIM